MFNSPVLNLVILLSFVYFIGSLMLSTVIEAFAGWRKSRGRSLRNSLKNLLLDPDWVSFFPKLADSQHIKSLMNAKGDFPSYIPAGNFYMALMEKVGIQDLLNINAPDIQALEAAITGSALPKSMQDILMGLLAKANINVVPGGKNVFALFEGEVEQFYNNAMDRAGGSYKRNTRKWQLGIAFAVAAIVNIDTIKIVRDSLSNKEQLAKSADNIAANMDKIIKTDDGFMVIADNDTLVQTISYAKADTAKTNADKTDSAAATNDDKTPPTIAQAARTIVKLQQFSNNAGGAIMGYDSWTQVEEEWFGKRIETTFCDSIALIWKGKDRMCDSSQIRICDSLMKLCETLKKTNKVKAEMSHEEKECNIANKEQDNKPAGFNRFLTFITKVIGIALTAFALQLGSNYWFDRLNQFLNLRATGKKPDETKPTT